MKYIVLAIFLNCKNIRVIFIFQNGFENWILNDFCNWSFELNFGISAFFTIFEKELFKVPAVSDSDVSIFSFSVRFIFFLDILACQRAKVLLFSKIFYYPNFGNTRKCDSLSPFENEELPLVTRLYILELWHWKISTRSWNKSR